jgi:hypothetical protein
VKQDKKTTEGEARDRLDERKEETKPTKRLTLDLELTLGRNLWRRPPSLVVSPAESIGSPCPSGASTPGAENVDMVEFMWDEGKGPIRRKERAQEPRNGPVEGKRARATAKTRVASPN